VSPRGRRAATVAAIGASLAGLAVAREARKSGTRVLRERIRRSSRIWRLAARRAVAFARLRTTGASDDALDDFHLHTAEQVFELLGGMKGAVMKLGQMFSFIAEGLPESYSDVLRGLQQSAPPMASHLVGEVVQRELGGEPERVFDRFSHEPVAAASIGQVHRARLFDGTDVAVKLQYPGVDVAIRADLDNAMLLYTAAKMVAPGMEPGPIVDELKERMGDELDYRLEATAQEEFARAYDGHPFIRVPRVRCDYSTARVLTSEWVEGASFYDLLDRRQPEKDLIAEKLFRFWAGSVCRLRVFNGDPHPGNYFFVDDGSIWFLDFGLVKRFSDADITNLRERISAIRTGDPDLIYGALVRNGWLKPDAPVDPRRLAELARLSSLPLVTAPFTYTRDYLRESVEAFFMVDGPYGDVIRHMTVPRDQLILSRMLVGLGALASRLGATGNWAALLDEYLFDGPPSTPLGEQVAPWPLGDGGLSRSG
jgi:predicted unusual protein kinase regulating ubiquinone biosynthesis (AarF/ABC1/UbiB family)